MIMSSTQDYIARILISYAVAIMALVAYGMDFTGLYLLVFAIFLVWYPHILNLFGRNYHEDDVIREHFYSVSDFCDGLVFGVGLVGLHFAVPMVGNLLMMLSVHLLARSAIYGWGRGMLGLVCGLVVASYFTEWSLRMEVHWVVALVCDVCALGYVCITAYYLYRKMTYCRDIRFELQEQKFEAKHLSQKLTKYLSPQIWQSIFSGRKDVKIESQRKKLVVFFSDIKGFTELSDELEAEELTELLNLYLNDMAKIAIRYGGTIDKFMGDGIMVFFGDPISQGTKQDVLACVSMAIEMRRHMRVLSKRWQARGISTQLEIRMGINTGYCTVGNFGAENRLDYTIIGKEVNLASRLESEAKAGEIIISRETYALVKDKIMCRDQGYIHVKGFARAIPMFLVVDMRRDLGAEQSFVEHEADGFSMYVDVDKIQNYDKEQVVKVLEQTATQIRKRLIL